MDVICFNSLPPETHDSYFLPANVSFFILFLFKHINVRNPTFFLFFFFFINSLQSDYLCVFGNPSIGYETMIEYFFWGFFSLMISWFLLSFVFFVSGLGCSFLTKDKDLVFTLIPSPGTYEFYYTYSFLYIFLFVYAYGG